MSKVEIRDLKRRVRRLEGSFGLLSGQVKLVHRDLLAFQERTEERFDRLDGKADGLESKFGQLETKIDSLDRKIDSKFDGIASALPAIIRSALLDYNKAKRH